MEEGPLDDAKGPPAEGAAREKPTAKESRRKRVILWMAIALVALLLIAGLMGGIYAWRFLAAADSLTVGDIDVSGVPDGTYEGSYSLFHVKAAVEVSVEDGRITAITLTDSGKMAEETQQEIADIFGAVVSSQTLQVDLTSGASVSKKVSLKAVEEALTGAD